jgi:hypothetical protein
MDFRTGRAAFVFQTPGAIIGIAQTPAAVREHPNLSNGKASQSDKECKPAML